MNIELYINKQLCDIENPNDFSIFLKRQFLNPAELNTKDAMKSYSISLPASTRNNEVFGFKCVEEIRSKFAIIYDAYLTIGGVKIFNGKFRLSQVTRESYSGNLGVPAQRGISDIFKDRTMTQAGTWVIPFGEFADSIKEYNSPTYNSAEYGNIAPCIFPYVMYGLLPKEEINGRYSEKNVWDETVRLKADDLPPSINCLRTIKQIFANEKLNISGSAFSDNRLTNLYMSYKNPTDYEMEWNYGKLGVVKLSGQWLNFDPNLYQIERIVSQNDKDRKMYAVDLFNATNAITFKDEDKGNNVAITQKTTPDNIPYQSVSFVVPFSGLYKVQFDAEIILNKAPNVTLEQNGVRVISPVSKLPNPQFPNQDTITTEGFDKRRFEIKLMRNWNEGNIDMSNIGYDRSFYLDNLNQTDNFDTSNPDNYNKYFPKPDEVVFIDPLQNPNIVCGVSFGANYNKNNPIDVQSLFCNPIAIKHGRSWDRSAERDEQAQSAVFNSGYVKWGETADGNIGFEYTDQFKVDLINTETYAKTESNYTQGSGRVDQVIWLNKGERLTVCAVSDEGQLVVPYFESTQTYAGWLLQSINYNLNVEPYKSTNTWLKMDEVTNASTGTMDWNDTDTTDSFYSDGLDLIKFLPTEIKIDDWLENFCKAFNLVLTQLDNGAFELNVKQSRRTYSRIPLDFDTKADVNAGRRNAPLNLPSIYNIGFTINKDEQGFVESNDDGGGFFITGNSEGNVLAQTSFFSFNWFKDIVFTVEDTIHKFPIITDKEIWIDPTSRDYKEMLKKTYTNSPQRFWYKSNNIEVSGYGKQKIEVSLVRGEIDTTIRLDYHNKPFSLLSSYFTIFTNNNTSYTIIDCYLSPDEYNKLPYSLVSFNGDLYYPAEIDGYDPLGRRKATIKLIRKLL